MSCLSTESIASANNVAGRFLGKNAQRDTYVCIITLEDHSIDSPWPLAAFRSVWSFVRSMYMYPWLGRGKCGNEGFPVINFGVKKIKKRATHNSQLTTTRMRTEPPHLKSDRGHHRLALAAFCYGSNSAQDEPVVWSTRRHRRPSRVAGFLPHISRFTSLCRTGASVQLSSCVLQRRGHPPDAAVGC